MRSEAGDPDITALIRDLAAAGESLAAAESLTGGQLTAALTSVPGASAVVHGAVVAYCSSAKVALLGVDPFLLAQHGPVSAEVATQMARGARAAFGATYGLATTGEAGPDSASGHPVGTVFVAVSGPHGTRSRHLPHAAADRAGIRAIAVAGALRLLVDVRQPAGDLPDTDVAVDLGNNTP